MMARRESRVINVSVVGLSGTEKEKGDSGIGKSCICNRFVRPKADDYSIEHISMLSPSDFGGRVVNNDHFLFWGENSVVEEGVNYLFRVVEQTEFVDDSSFQPFKIGKTEPYYKRCAAMKLTSAEKLMYICKNQLVLEQDFEERFLPEGRFNVDGFICVFDVSLVPNRSSERQIEFTALILANLLKTKKPVVLVTSKNDDARESLVREAEKLFTRKEFKGCIGFVETSAHENINIEQAFLTLAHMIDKSKGKPKVTSFMEGSRIVREKRDAVTTAYKNLLAKVVTDYKMQWSPTYRRMMSEDCFKKYVDVFGTEHARRLFWRHTMAQKESLLDLRESEYLMKLEKLIPMLLPDLETIADRSWPSILRWMVRQPWFSKHFQEIPDGLPWRKCDSILEGKDYRIPFDLLDASEAENRFREHCASLRSQQRKMLLKEQFRHQLEESANVGPGKTLEEVSIFFLGREFFSALSNEDKDTIYRAHQEKLCQRAKADFLELLYERADVFSKLRHAGPVSSEDLRYVNNRLQQEARYRALNRLEDEQKTLILNHLAFLQYPSADRCPFKAHCVDVLLPKLLSTKAHRPQSWCQNSQFNLSSLDKCLNLVLLGQDGLATELANAIKLQSLEDEYVHEKEVYSLAYRVVEGDVTKSDNELRTAEFLPRGCFCIYNSLNTLQYIIRSLEQTVMTDPQKNGKFQQKSDLQGSLQGLPITLVLGHRANLTDKQLQTLREEGQNLADRLQCPFVDIPSSLMTDDAQRFHPDQVNLAMHHLIQSIKHRAYFLQPWQMVESIEPDIRIEMCLMCGDEYPLELPLSPLLSHQCCYAGSDASHPTLTLETYLGQAKRRVELSFSSLHTAEATRRDNLFHGYVLVYSAHRKASFSTMAVFARSLSHVPVKIISVSETDGTNAFFTDDSTQALIVDGNALADEIKASFLTAGPKFAKQTASYTPFFKEAWDRKDDTEAAFSFLCRDVSAISLSDRIDGRHGNQTLAHPYHKSQPAKSLPVHSFTLGKASKCRDDHVYDPVAANSRASSSSPLLSESSNDIYAEIAPPDTENLINNSRARKPTCSGSGWHEGDNANVPLLESDRSPASTGLPTIPTLSKSPKQRKLLHSNKFADVRAVLNRNFTNDSTPMVNSSGAPLATPENIEIQDYGQVKDALPKGEPHYCLVQDALPAGLIHRVRPTNHACRPGSESDSEPSLTDNWVPPRPVPSKRRSKGPHHSTEAIPAAPPRVPGLPSVDSYLIVDNRKSTSGNSTEEELETRKLRYIGKDDMLGINTWSDSDLAAPLVRKGSAEEDVANDGLNRYDEEDGIWKRRLWIGKPADQVGKLKKKEEKKAREDEKRKIKEEEKKLKEQQKLQKRQSKKKDCKELKGVTGFNVAFTLAELAASSFHNVPLFVRKCIDFLDKEGITSEGLYRVPGNRAHAEFLVDVFRDNMNIDFFALDIPCNAVATALKDFFNELPEPVIPRHLCMSFTKAAEDQDRKSQLMTVSSLLARLPDANRETLRLLMEHLDRVTRHYSHNNMGSKNLAICWWPTLFRPEVDSFESMSLISRQLEEMVALLIEEHPRLFATCILPRSDITTVI